MGFTAHGIRILAPIARIGESLERSRGLKNRSNQENATTTVINMAQSTDKI